MPEIEIIESPKNDVLRSGELEDDHTATGFEHTGHFGEATVEIGEIADTEGDSQGIKTVAGERELLRVGLSETHTVSEPSRIDFLLSDFDHFRRYITADDLAVEGLAGTYGHVGRACGDIEHFRELAVGDEVDAPAPPTLVDAEREEMVEEIIAR